MTAMTTAPPMLDTGTRLAVDRTRLAYERTMMAWIRTAASLISFGFTIYKFFQLELKEPAAADRLIGARGFALILIGTGLVALLLAGIQHRESLKSMKQMYGALPRSVAGPVAALVAGLGILALIGVLIRA
jgi:putative membrane protein